MPDLAWPTENDKTIKEIPLKQTVEIPTPLQGDLYEFLIKNASYYFLIKILILIRKASPEGAACFVIYKERNHKTSLI